MGRANCDLPFFVPSKMELDFTIPAYYPWGCMQRGSYIPVTQIPVLIPCSFGARDGMANFLPQGLLFSPVRVLRDKELDKNTAGGKKLWRSLGKRETERLLALIAFRKATEERDAVAVANLEEGYRRILVEVLQLEDTKTAEAQSAIQTFARLFAKDSGPSTGTPQRILAKVLSNALRKAQLVLWWKDTERRFLPAIYCPDVATALYVSALLGIVGGRALLVCPHCGEPFVRQRSDQDYCSIRCREAHRVARWRATPHGKGNKAEKRRR